MIPYATSAFHFMHRNRTYYLPFLISTQYLPSSLRPYYTMWICFELFGHLLTAFSIVLLVFVIWKSHAFHINMQIVNSYCALILGGTNLLTRVVLIQVELKTVKIDDYILPVHFIKNCAWTGIYNYVVYTTVERYAALRFASDYEQNRRTWVSGVLIAINTFVTVPFAYLLITDKMNGAIYSAIVCIVSNISCWMFSRIKTRSIFNERRLAKFANVSQYSVSHRWQVKENIRMAKVLIVTNLSEIVLLHDIRFYVFGIAAMIMFYLPLFFVPPLLLGDDINWRGFLELSKAAFQLICAYGFFIAYVFCTFSIGRHVDYLRSQLGLKTNVRITPLFGATQSSDEYFTHLSGWWTP